MGWAEANRFPFFRPVSIFNGAENRRVFHRFKPPRFSSSRASLFQRDDCSRGEGKLCTYIVYNYYWQFFGNDSNLRQERKKNSIKILIHVNMQTRDVAFVSLSLLCGDNSRDFPRVVTFRAVCRSVSTLGERISEKGGLSTIFHSALGEEI